MFNNFKIDKNKLYQNIALLIVALIIGVIVSAVAQLLIITAQNVFEFIFLNEHYKLSYTIFDLELNLIPLLVCIPASIIVGIIMLFLKLPRWFGPADTIFAAHNKAGKLDLKGGFGSTLASLVSIGGGASVGIYGPLVHFGATISAFLRRLKFMPKIQHDIIIGSGVAAAISAAFGAPLAGIIFAHETVLRHFSLKAITSIALSSITANYAAYKIGIVTPPLLLEKNSFELSDVIFGLLLIGPLAALVAIVFMKSMIVIGTLPKKMSLDPWKAPIIAGFLCGIVGLFLDEVLGLGTQTLIKVITENLTITFLLTLLFFKLILTSCCIGFGFFGGTFSPALFLGGIIGALVFNVSFFDFQLNHLSVLAVSGMAAVSSSVIGAPITAIILVLELTGSYEYAIASIIPISICTFITSRIFGNSFFDKQLLNRGIAISKGREQILLNEINISDYVNKNFTQLKIDMSIKTAISLLVKNNDTEGYVLTNNKIFIGKIRLIDLINKKNKTIKSLMENKPLVLNSELSLMSSIEKLSKFIGESVPVIEKSSKKLLGIISENDVLDAYLKISYEINQIEKN